MRLADCLQTVGTGRPDDYPKMLEHGQTANFWITSPVAWVGEFGTKFIGAHVRRSDHRKQGEREHPQIHPAVRRAIRRELLIAPGCDCFRAGLSPPWDV
jgi:hypothetical protein